MRPARKIPRRSKRSPNNFMTTVWYRNLSTKAFSHPCGENEQRISRAFRLFENKPYKMVRKIVIAIVGVSVLSVGAAMIFLPGPAFVVIPVGLAILATEFAWAKVLLDNLKEKINWKTTAKAI